MLAQVLWNSTRALPVAAAAAVLLAAAVLWLYPPQVRDLRGPWRWGLPGLRALAVLALAASLLKPAVLRPRTLDEGPVVAVVVDRSRSMSVVDNARTPAQLVALADGMGRLPEGARPGAAAAVAADLERLRPLVDAAARARGDWGYARVSGRGVETARRRFESAAAALGGGVGPVVNGAGPVADARLRAALGAVRDAAAPAGSASQGDDESALPTLRSKLDDAIAAARLAQAASDEQLYRADEAVRRTCEELSKLSRSQLVGQVLLKEGSGLLTKIAAQASVAGFSAAEDVSPMALPAGAGASELPAVPEGRASEVARAVRGVLEQTAGREVAAVVFFSDGRQVGGEGSVTAGLSAAGVPVFAVSVAPEGAVRDLSFRNVTVPASAYVGETVNVGAELRPLGLTAFTTELTATAGDGPRVTRAVAATQPAGQEPQRPSAEFRLKLDKPGAQQITLAVHPLPGEATAENNTVRRWVKVLSQKVKVAAYAGSAGWDFQYLRAALSRAPWVDLRAGVLPPGEATRLPLRAQDILDQDVIVLSDVPAKALEQDQWEALYRLVAERGGSAVLIAGEAHLPAEYSERLVAANLLPYPPDAPPTWRMWPGEQPLFRLAPAASAADKPFLRLGDVAGDDPTDGRRGVERWQALPGLFRFLPITRLKATATSLLIEVASGTSVLTETRVGAGRAFLFGANETWRWRLRSGERDQDRFWLGLIRYAAGEPYALRSERVAMDVNKVAVEAGETVRVRVRVLHDAPADAGDARYVLEVTSHGAVVQSVPLTRAAAPDIGLEARVERLPEGDYEIRLVDSAGKRGAPGTAPPAGGPGLSIPLHVGRSYDAELADVSGDESLLRRLAESSGGELFTLDQVNRLPERLRPVTQRRPRYAEQRLWDSPFLFVFVVGCLAAEWAARKRVGLA